MKLFLDSHEIDEAIKDYVEKTGISLANMDVEVTMKATRKSKDGVEGAGGQAEVTITAMSAQSISNSTGLAGVELASESDSEKADRSAESASTESSGVDTKVSGGVFDNS